MATAPSSLTPFQATYHWRNKDCFPWSSAWFKQELPGLSISADGASAEIVSVDEVEGDVDLGQRKGKLLTIYDCRLVMSWIGKTKEGEEVKGKLTIPEVSHECLDGLSEYQYDWSTSTSSTSSFDAFLRKSFPPVLSNKLNTFAPALVAANGLDSTTGSAAGSGATTPSGAGAVPARYSPAPPGEVRKSTPSSTASKDKEKSKVNTSGSVRIETRLQASAGDIWALLTDEKRIPMWARSAAKMSTNEGDPYELFGGNVVGKIVSAEPGKKLVQTWQLRNPNWPSDHFGTMTITLDQGTDSTATVFDLAGVPLGQEETIQNAVDTYYVRGLKQMGLVLSSSSISSQRPRTRESGSKSGGGSAGKKLRKKSKSVGERGAVEWGQIAGWAGVVGLVAVFGGIVWRSFP